jgi:hypothetical protein
MSPARQGRSLLIRKLGDETLVYNLETHRASCLNREAAAVLDACDGRRSLADIREHVGRTLGTPVEDGYVELAIDRLSRSGLVDGAASPPSARRRDLLGRLAAATALALPTVTSVLAPTPAEAATCLPDGEKCIADVECCSGACMMGKCSTAKVR